jgi:2-haloacid dehalogenase
MTITTCVFDAYGTLFDVAGAARKAAAEPGQEALAALWPRLAEDWRRKQLEYTWLRAITGDHTDFRAVTGDGLDWAMEAAGLNNPALRDRLMALYDELPAYSEVHEMLKTLKSRGFATAILSNGSPAMLDSAITSAGIGNSLDAVLSVESAGVFKPSARVYDLVGEYFAASPRNVLFVSSNGWDVCSAAAYGFTTAWVNRAGLPMDRLSAQPAHVLPDLTAIPEIAGAA